MVSAVPENYIPETIRAYHVALMDLFNNIRVRDYTQAPEHDGTIVETLRVPVHLSMQEKYQAYKLAEAGKKYYPKYPKLSITWSGMNYNGERAKGTNVKRSWKDVDTGYTDVDNYIVDTQPIPYDFQFEVDIRTQSMSHFTQILENILPYFNPARHMRIKEFRFLNVERDIKVRLENVSQEFLIDQESSTRRYVNGQLGLTVEGFIYAPWVSDGRGGGTDPDGFGSIIKEIRTQYFASEMSQGLSAVAGYNTSGWDSSATFSGDFDTSGVYLSGTDDSFEYYVSDAFGE